MKKMKKRRDIGNPMMHYPKNMSKPRFDREDIKETVGKVKKKLKKLYNTAKDKYNEVKDIYQKKKEKERKERKKLKVRRSAAYGHGMKTLPTD